MLDRERSYINKEEVRITVVQPSTDGDLLTKRSKATRSIGDVCICDIGDRVSEDLCVQKVVY